MPPERTFIVDILPAHCQIELIFAESAIFAVARNIDSGLTGTLIAVDPETWSLCWCDLDPDGLLSAAGFLISRSTSLMPPVTPETGSPAPGHDAALYEARRGLADDSDGRPSRLEAEHDEVDES